MDGKITIATGASRSAPVWKNVTLQWSDLLSKLSVTTRTRETVAEYKHMTRAKQDRIKDVGGFVGGWLKEGRRKTGHLEHRSLITLDADFARLDLLELYEMAFECAGAVYSTHKHTPEAPRLRLIVPLSRTVDGDEYQAASRKLAEILGMDLFDDTTYQPTRLMYWPSTPADGEYIYRAVDGPFLDPDDLLKLYPDWRDASYWPESGRTATVRHRTAAKQGDPEAKPGIVGAFCRCYDVEAAIARFLPDKYTACSSGRYTYTGGSTSAGLVIYDGGKFAYSNHATDPASGTLCNAFDLVRLHLYSAMDEDAEPDTPVNRLPSYAAMSDMARDDPAVRTELTRARFEAARDDFALKEDPAEWLHELTEAGLTVDKRGNPEATINNVYIILTVDHSLRGALAYNDFKDRPVTVRDLPWRQVRDPVNGDVWTDTDDSELRRYLELCYGITGKERILDAAAAAARLKSFHPVREYLRGLSWDGTQRLDTLLIDYLGAEDTPYTRAVTRKAFTAAAARVTDPGCKFDYVLTLSGPQGIGKSTLIARMSRGWYTDSLAGIGTKEAYEGIQGYWLVELGELAAMRKTDIEATKNFISKQVDSYRAPYGRRVEDHPRQCVFFGTTNSTGFLRDDTGNRRFWPVRLGERPHALTVWDDLTGDVIDQLWAEAVHRLEDGEDLTLPPELLAAAQAQQERFTEDDPRAGEVQAYLDTLLPEGWASMDRDARRGWFAESAEMRPEGVRRRDRVCVAEIWQECFGRDAGAMDRQKAGELRTIMRRMPGWSESSRKLFFGPYGSQWCFEREDAEL